jgi:RNA-directed DNA polymerase
LFHAPPRTIPESPESNVSGNILPDCIQSKTMHTTSLWEQLISFSNIHLAFRKAAKGKRSQPPVALFERNLEENLIDIQISLLSGLYHPGGYNSFYIHDPKRRLISAASFKDRVVHHALCNVIEPIFERKFIDDSYANRKDKGNHKALDRCTQFLRRYESVVAFDIQQFFPSIDHAILLDILQKTIHDTQVIALCREILTSGQDVFRQEFKPIYLPGDDLLAACRPRGLPIGNLTSQFWANVYLNGFDHFVKRDLKCKAYLRYVDDFLLFSNDLDELHVWRHQVIDHLAQLRLTLHENRAHPRPSRCGVPFLGFQVFPDYRRLKRAKVVSARRKLKAKITAFHQGALSREKLKASIQSWINHASFGDTWGLREAILKDLVL